MFIFIVSDVIATLLYIDMKASCQKVGASNLSFSRMPSISQRNGSLTEKEE